MAKSKGVVGKAAKKVAPSLAQRNKKNKLGKKVAAKKCC